MSDWRVRLGVWLGLAAAAAFVAAGFSLSTCFPAARASIAISTWVQSGVAMITASTFP